MSRWLLVFFALWLATIPPVAAAPPLALAEFCFSPGEPGFAVAHAASAMGIPFVHSSTLEEALRQPMVVLAGPMTGRSMPPEVEAQLKAYVAGGGTLVLDDLEARAALNLAGLSASSLSTQRYSLIFHPETGDPGLARLLIPASRTISLGRKSAGRAVNTQALILAAGSDAQSLATFEDGSTALTCRPLGRGRVYALGVSLRDLILRPQNNRDYEAQRWYDNHFEPGADVPQMLLRDWYLAYIPGAVTFDPAPEGRSGSLLMTHDVDFQKSMPNMLPFVRAEQARGIHATYFIQTKYTRDYEDIAFFDARAEAVIRQVANMGAEIACHTVCHSYGWRTFPVGTGLETVDNYKPRVMTRGISGKTGRTIGGTVAGEVRVPKQLLEHAVPGLNVDAFRSGYLLINPAQWTVQEGNGYRYDSSYSADDVMTAFPYTAMENADFDQESRITEFPVLLSDSVSPLKDYAGQFAQVLDAESALHGVCVVLIHPDEVADKLAAEMALIDHVQGNFWVGGLEAFGQWWSARAGLTTDTEETKAGETVHITARQAISGLTLDFGRAMTLNSCEGTTSRTANQNRSFVLGPISAGQTVTLQLASPKESR